MSQASNAPEYILKSTALSYPFANGRYDKENADRQFILGCESYREWLEALTPADVRPVVRGKWIPVHLGDMQCSICGDIYGVCGGLLGDYNFCPNCGSGMRGGDAE